MYRLVLTKIFNWYIIRHSVNGEKMEDRKYAFITEGDVFGVMAVPGDIPVSARYKAGFNNGAIVVDITDKQEVEWGWTYDGVQFHPPIEDQVSP